MVSSFTYIVFGLAAIMIVSTAIQLRKRRITPAWALFWTGIWVVGSVMSFFTGLLDRIGNYVIGTQGNQLVVYGTILLLFVFAYRLFLEQQTVRKEITQLVEELAKKK